MAIQLWTRRDCRGAFAPRNDSLLAMTTMQLGMIGLGRMGGNMVRRLMRAGHQCVVYDVHPPAVKALAGEGATGTDSLAAFVAKGRLREMLAHMPVHVVTLRAALLGAALSGLEIAAAHSRLAMTPFSR